MIAFGAQAVLVTEDYTTDDTDAQAAAEQMFEEFDTSLHDDAIWSDETRAAHEAYVSAAFKDVARAMVENVNFEVAAVFLNTDVDTLQDEKYQFVAKHYLHENFMNE